MAGLVSTKYRSDETPGVIIYLVKVSQAVLDFDADEAGRNFAPNQEVTLPIHVNANAGRSGAGLHCRGVMIAWDGPQPEGYTQSGKLFIPILNSNKYNQIRVHEGCTYLGGRGIIIGKRPEVIR